MTENLNKLVIWALQGICTIAIGLIVYFGNSMSANISSLDTRQDKTENRVTAIESTQYTVGEAKTDREKTNERVRAVELQSARDSSKLDSIEQQLIAMGQQMSQINAKLDKQRSNSP